MLTEIAQRGRAFGIHLVLASQKISQVPALSLSGGRPFEQFPIRIGLRLAPDEARRLFADDNTAAADLREPGTAILNGDFGSRASNSPKFRVAMVSDADAQQVRTEVLLRYAADAPLTFTRRNLVPESVMVSHRHDLKHKAMPGAAIIGLGLDHSPVVLDFSRNSPKKHVGLFGTDATAALAIFSAMISSLSTQAESPQFSILAPISGELAGLVDLARAAGVHLDPYETTEKSNNGPKILFVGPDAVPEKRLDSFADQQSGCTIVGWWHSFAALEARAQMSRQELRVLLHSRILLSGLSDPMTVTSSTDSNFDLPERRCGIVQGSEQHPRLFVPFDFRR